MTKTQPMEVLWKVQKEHISQALSTYKNDINVQSRFKEPKSDYLLEEGELHPTKQVFATALNLSMALERSCIPDDFTTKMARRVFRKRGFQTIRMIELKTPRSEDTLSSLEGDKKMFFHFRRERSSKLSKAKKRQMKKELGYLQCELCDLIPSKTYGEHGNNCIEVHHTKPLADYLDEEQTHINDLKCLCANCHRIEHAKLRAK